MFRTLSIFFSAVILHSFPITMYYQGMLTDSTGKPIQTTDSIRVQLHESAISTTPIWQETHYTTTKNGAFSILLGTITPLPITPFIEKDSLFLEFHQKNRQKTSRTKVGISAYAIRSLYSDSSAKAAISFLADNAKNAEHALKTDSAKFSDTAKYLSENKWKHPELSIESPNTPVLSFKQNTGDTTICRARFTANSNGTLTLDMSNASGSVEVKSLLTVKAGTEVLSVAGSINASSYKVSGVTLNVPDYVFDTSYELSPLSHVENYIKSHSHLPDIPSAKEINGDGLDVVDMNLRLLRKIEEITLHLIDQEKKIKTLEAVILEKEKKEGGSP
ncbi:MAG: hypothetical protein JNL74_09365 [Fibrobacteres bacterium]|nr:hypothetical protein [Fibrobacterota bacterium]